MAKKELLSGLVILALLFVLAVFLPWVRKALAAELPELEAISQQSHTNQSMVEQSMIAQSMIEAEKYKQDADWLQGVSDEQLAALFKKLSPKGNGRRYVFISFSMPHHVLANLIEDAKHNGFVPVLKGFKDGSYLKTVQAISKLVDKTKYGVIISPEEFKEFEITQVPTFVIAERKGLCLPSMSCKAKYNKLSGNITAQEALRRLTEKGEAL